MLRTIFLGAIAAIVGTKLKKAYDAGKLDPYIDRAKDAANDAQQRLSERTGTLRRPAPAPAASKRARRSPSDSPSRPAKSAPWPADERALPGGA
jgi:hypothetical protein